MDLINEYEDKDWNWFFICDHDFAEDKQNYIIKKCREHLALLKFNNGGNILLYLRILR